MRMSYGNNGHKHTNFMMTVINGVADVIAVINGMLNDMATPTTIIMIVNMMTIMIVITSMSMIITLTVTIIKMN
jgi:hypothetical protein